MMMVVAACGRAEKSSGYDGRHLEVLFVSVDPWRDTVDKVAEYVKRTHTRSLSLLLFMCSCSSVAVAAAAVHVLLLIGCRCCCCTPTEFHPRMVGLTGTPEQVSAAARAYRVYTSRPPTQAAEDGDEDYLVDHSVFAYLMGPDGKFQAYFGQNVEEEQMAEQIAARLQAYYDPPQPSFLENLKKRVFG